MKIVIRKTLPKDARRVHDIVYHGWVKFFPNKEYGITRKSLIDAWGDKEKAIKKMRNNIKKPPYNRGNYVIEVDGEVVGQCGYYLHKDVNEISSLYVDVKHHNKGYGGILFDKILKQIGRNKKVMLDTPVYQKASIGFYKKHGFKINNKAFPNHHINRKIPVVRLVK